MAEPFQIEIGIPNWLRRRTFHEPNSFINVLDLAHEEFGVWTGPKTCFYHNQVLQLKFEITIFRATCEVNWHFPQQSFCEALAVNVAKL